MFKQIVQNSIKNIKEDYWVILLSIFFSSPKIITLSAFLIYNIQNLNHKINWELFIKQNYNRIFFIMFLWIIGYEILQPIWETATIHRLNTKEKISDCIKQWKKKFFSMFEINNLTIVLSQGTLTLSIIKIISLGLINWKTVLIILWLRTFAIFFSPFFLNYSKLKIIIEDTPIRNWLKRWLQKCFQNFIFTTKAVLLWWSIFFRIIINSLTLIWIPILIVFILRYFKTNFYGLENFLIITTWIIILYISAIINSFFLSYWYEIYTKITKAENLHNQDFHDS